MEGSRFCSKECDDNYREFYDLQRSGDTSKNRKPYDGNASENATRAARQARRFMMMYGAGIASSVR